jgi:hypothetical protein
MSALLSLMLLLYDTQFSYGFVYKFITCSKNSKINDYYMIVFVHQVEFGSAIH